MNAPLRMSLMPRHPPPSYGWLGGALVLSAGLHVGLFTALGRQKPAVDVPPPTEMVMEVNRPEPPAPPPPKAPPPVVQPRAPTVKPPPAPRQQVPPPANPPPAPPPPQAPLHIGVSLSSTTHSGGFAVPVGNSLAGTADTHAVDANQVRPYTAPHDFVPSYDVTESPHVDAEPDLQTYYPEEARKQNQEGRVTLTLSIDTHGAVARAQVLRGAGNGFDEAAVHAALEKLHFKPARVNGKAVSTEITYTITFILD